MSTLIEWLESLNKKDSRAKAVLKHSLAFEPGMHFPAFPYVEPFLQGEVTQWRRNVHYLVAGLWAAYRTEEGNGSLSLGQALALLPPEKKTSSLENRFIALLDADEDQLPYRLRQLVALLKETPLDFDKLLKDLLYWHVDSKYTQRRWAQEYYRSINTEKTEENPQIASEEIQA